MFGSLALLVGTVLLRRMLEFSGLSAILLPGIAETAGSLSGPVLVVFPGGSLAFGTSLSDLDCSVIFFPGSLAIGVCDDTVTAFGVAVG